MSTLDSVPETRLKSDEKTMLARPDETSGDVSREASIVRPRR
jgi:hypothetical protein